MTDSMKLHKLVSELCMKLELSDPELLRRAEASWNPEYGSLDGSLVDRPLNQLRSILPSFADDLKRDAYNEMADAEKLGRLTDGEVDFDYRIVDALLDPVLEMLLRENDVNRPSRNILH